MIIQFKFCWYHMIAINIPCLKISEMHTGMVPTSGAIPKKYLGLGDWLVARDRIGHRHARPMIFWRSNFVRILYCDWICLGVLFQIFSNSLHGGGVLEVWLNFRWICSSIYLNCFMKKTGKVPWSATLRAAECQPNSTSQTWGRCRNQKGAPFIWVEIV